MAIYMKLMELQSELKVDKTHYNSFSDFNYRNKEDILEAVKPLAREKGCVVYCDDEIVSIAEGWVYVSTTAFLVDAETGETVSATGHAREPQTKKGMDSSQITGAASSYAGKRALGNLFSIDDGDDSDRQKPEGPFIAACTACGTKYQFESAEQMAQCQCQCGNRQFK